MKPYLIAEIGINHNGSLEIAKKLIDAAVECRFDAVKFQKREIELVYSEEILNSHRDSPWGKTQREQKNGLEFGEDEYREIDSYCKSKKISWFASAWDPKSLTFLEKFDLSFNKIASAMIVDKEFLNQVSKQKKHTFISTGMSSTNNIDDAVAKCKHIEEVWNDPPLSKYDSVYREQIWLPVSEGVVDEK